MQTAPKPFSQASYNENDGKARRLIKNYYISKGINISDNPDVYGRDLILEDGTYVEVEIKREWDASHSSIFPYDFMHIPERKEKFLDGKKTLFYVIAGSYNRAMVVDNECLSKCPVIIKDVRNRSVPESFFAIKREDCEMIDLPKLPEDMGPIVPTGSIFERTRR